MGPSGLAHPDEYELVDRSSLDSLDTFELDDADFQTSGSINPQTARSSVLQQLVSAIPFLGRRHRRPIRSSVKHAAWSLRRPRTCRRRLSCRCLCAVIAAVVTIGVALVALASVLFPSYTQPPAHYDSLRQTALQSHKVGIGNPRGEKVFIAASIYDRNGDLAGGQWAENLLDLIYLLGPDNVYLSIYENDAGSEASSALQALEDEVPSNCTIVNDSHLDLNDVQHITLPDGSERVKRIAFLAEVRNRALRHLDEPDHAQFDKLLYMNDVYFDPIDVLQLLFSTNVDEEGIAQYRAACAVDFINPFKFYDTFATRDLEGYGMGLPIYPWFSRSGNGDSRRDVHEQKDAVRVRSCWGGMVAFDAQFFQRSESPDSEPNEPARFRAETDPYWDASECCLIHADIQIPPHESEEPVSTGIYMNPFVRVAYDTKTLSWLGFTRRFERLYSIPQAIINVFVGLPWSNPRRTEEYGQQVEEEVWVPDEDGGGSFQSLERTAGTGGFCGRRALQVMVPNPKEGEKNWEMIPVPS